MSRTLRLLLLLPLGLGQGLFLPACAGEVAAEPKFHDVRAQTEEFLRYNDEIVLTAEQQEVFREALTPLPAPCCSDRSALTCCCPCNQARTWWGLTKHLIAERGFDAEQTRAKVAEWFAFTHPEGAEGKACYSGRCPLPFAQDGCGGMRAGEVSF